MASGGRRYRSILYTYVLNRWWRRLLGLGLVLLGAAAALGLLPLYIPQMRFLTIDDQRLWALGAVGMVVLLAAIFLISIRKSAYVQPFSDHLRLVTPFLRLNIAYRRIRQASSTEMNSLFPLAKAKGWQRNFLHPLSDKTAVVLDLNGFPLSKPTLHLFLSPFFFPDRTARLALLVQNWMGFSQELESFRSAWQEAQRPRGDGASVYVAGTSDPKR